MKDKVEAVEIKGVNTKSVNTYKVPLKMWRSWNDKARCVFNAVYSSMLNNQELFRHPKQRKVQDEHWTTTCWNAAWTAANEINKVE